MATFFKDGVEYENVGGIDIPLPPRPPKNKIANYNLPKQKQKFQRTIVPDSFKRIPKDEFGSPIYNQEQKDFIAQEFNRIVNGYWCYIYGDPYYIPGKFYAELNYWKIDVGLKEYRDRDRRFHLLWKYCEDDPNCYGLIYMKHRRDGATHRACAINYFTTIQNRESHSGIQSKTGTDAGKVFKKLVSAWRKLPQFLQPIHEGTTFPKKALQFFEPAERIGKNNRRVKTSEALESWIDFLPTQSEAYDGDKLLFYHMDEAGKTVEANVSETWDIVKECLNLGDKIVGKGLITSTVAEFEKKGGKYFKEIWDMSDQCGDRDENGRTLSGLYRLFIPAYDGLEGFIDEYGFSLIEPSQPTAKTENQKLGAKRFLENKREGYRKAGKGEKLSEYKRLYPFNEKECFAGASGKCEFDIEKIETRLEEFTYKKFSKRYDLDWEGGKRDTRVVARGSSNGPFQFAWMPGKVEETNRVVKTGERHDLLEGTNQTYLRNIYKPDNCKRFVIGIDPYDHDITVSGSGSKAAAYVLKKHDELEEVDVWNNVFVVQYLHRPKMAKIFYEDMIKLCVFFGCEMLYETQKPGIKRYFEDRGYEQFLMLKVKDAESKLQKMRGNRNIEVGQAASTKTTQQIAEHTEEYVYECCHKVYFQELLEDWRDFDIMNTEKHDCTMASGYTLIAANKVYRERPKPLELPRILPSFNNQGLTSTRNV